jgi:hypothetical protein
VRSALKEIVDRGAPYQACNAFAVFRGFYRWAVNDGVIEHSPCDRVSAKYVIGAKVPRQRVLTDDELRLVWRAAGMADYPVRRYGEAVAAHRSPARSLWDEGLRESGFGGHQKRSFHDQSG